MSTLTPHQHEHTQYTAAKQSEKIVNFNFIDMKKIYKNEIIILFYFLVSITDNNEKKKKKFSVLSFFLVAFEPTPRDREVYWMMARN